MKDDSGGAAHEERRRLAAIMFTDMVGFSRQMGSNEARTLQLLEVHNQFIQRAAAEHHGVVIKTVGDAFLVDFPSVVHAVQCAQQIQRLFRTHNAGKEAGEQIHVRVGIHLGDVVQKDGDVFGDGVNIASRLQGLAEPDTICISDMVYRDVAKKLDLGVVVSLGQPKLKNIAERFAVYALLPEKSQGFWQTSGVQKFRRMGTTHGVGLVVGLLLVISGSIFVVRPSFLPIRIPQSEIRKQESLPLPDKPSIIVLPFVNMGEDPKQAYFGDGITEDLTSDLSRISGLFVIARNSAFTYKGKAVKVQDVSREMGVRYVLEGSVRKADNRVRVTAQLIDATTGYHIWSERYDRELKEIFAVQDEIVQKIVATLKLQMTLLEKGYVVRKHTDSLEAYDFYLRGADYLWQTTKEANMRARQMFEKAIELDPRYAEAHALLASTYFFDYGFQWSQEPHLLERVFQEVQAAITIDASLPMGHSILARAYLEKRQHEQAIAAAERAITLDPNWADGYRTLSEILRFSQRPQEAVALAEKAMRLNPRYPFSYSFTLGFAHCEARQYEEAIAAQKAALARNPNFLTSHVCLTACYSKSGRMAEARAGVKEILRLNPNFSLEILRQRNVWKNPEDAEHMINALRKAGLK
jgi:adenylate cyclase